MGYGKLMGNIERKNHVNDDIIKRLSRIEGQVRGIKDMGERNSHTAVRRAKRC